MLHFSELNFSEPILRALSDKGYQTPTDIQERAIPHVLAGKDLLGIAQTGTGKTAAFALPILQHLSEEPSSKQVVLPRALILTPTRELVLQTLANLKHYVKYLSLKFGAIFGGSTKFGCVEVAKFDFGLFERFDRPKATTAIITNKHKKIPR